MEKSRNIYGYSWIVWIYGCNQMYMKTETLTASNRAQARAALQSSIRQGSSLQIPAITMCTMVKKCRIQPSHPLQGSPYLVWSFPSIHCHGLYIRITIYIYNITHHRFVDTWPVLGKFPFNVEIHRVHFHIIFVEQFTKFLTSLC